MEAFLFDKKYIFRAMLFKFNFIPKSGHPAFIQNIEQIRSQQSVGPKKICI